MESTDAIYNHSGSNAGGAPMRSLLVAVVALTLAASGWSAASLATTGAKMRHVPFVLGQREGQAVRKLTVAGFRAIVVRRRHRTTPRGLVYQQLPAAGTLAQAGSLVRLRVSIGR
jgi:beta-lactam-binding protein with PASTA domain